MTCIVEVHTNPPTPVFQIFILNVYKQHIEALICLNVENTVAGEKMQLLGDLDGFLFIEHSYKRYLA